jgi:PKHD-type hydroxylase
MNLNNYYYYFKKAIPERICDEIIKYGNQQREELAVIGGFTKNTNLTEKEKKILKKTRNSNVAWLNDQWIYNEIIPYVKQANVDAGWNFQWDVSETCQFTKYKLNQYYHWHCDSFHSPYNTPNDSTKHGRIRKLSVTVSLSDPKEYIGGELQFDFYNEMRKKNIRTCKEILEKGSLVVFPSFVWHQVKPVTKGTRYSLVIWNLGSQFR